MIRKEGVSKLLPVGVFLRANDEVDVIIHWEGEREVVGQSMDRMHTVNVYSRRGRFETEART